MEVNKKNNNGVKQFATIIGILVLIFSAYKFFSSDKVVKDYNDYQKQAVVGIEKIESALTEVDSLLNSDLDNNEFNEKFEKGVLDVYSEAITILEEPNPKTDEVKEFQSILVNAAKEQKSLLKTLSSAIEDGDIDSMMDIADEFVLSVEESDRKLTEFKDKLTKDYDIEFENSY